MKFLVFISLLAYVTGAPHTIPTNLLIRTQTFGNGKTLYIGIYIYKNGDSRLLLDSGRAIATSEEPHLTAYLAGEDGIYFYDDATEKLEKYGTITDGIIDIVRVTKSDDLYIITEDHTVYKVTEGGTKKTEVPEAKGAEKIGLDKNDDIFFYLNKELYVINNGVKKVEGLPLLDRVFLSKSETSDEVKLISDKGTFSVKADGTSSVYVPTEAEKAKEELGSDDFKTILKSIHDKEEQVTVS